MDACPTPMCFRAAWHKAMSPYSSDSSYLLNGYFNQQGVVINSDYERFSARAKIDSELNSWLKLGVNLAPTYMNANKTTQGHWAK